QHRSARARRCGVGSIALSPAEAQDSRAIRIRVSRFVVTSGRMAMASRRIRFVRNVLVGASLLLAAPLASGQTFLETFESGSLTTPGVTPSTGSVVPPGGITDSVDGDDGAIDGSGTAGHSFFSADGPTGITFTF